MTQTDHYVESRTATAGTRVDNAPLAQAGTETTTPSRSLEERTRALRPPPSQGPKRRSRPVSLAIRAALPVFLFAFWWVGTSQHLFSVSVLSSPSQVSDALRVIAVNGQLWSDLGASLSRLGKGLLIGGLAGLTLGVVAGLWKLGEEVFDSTIQMTRAVPFLALSPLFATWFGIGETFKVALITFATAIPMYTYTYLGVRGIDRKLVESAQSFGCTGYKLVWKVILPQALPSILMGLRICMATALLALIVAESVGASSGIGYLVSIAQQYNRTDYLVLSIVLYAAIGLLFDLVVRTIERVAMPWRTSSAVK
jgi:sulfonate transport system permease protein